MAAVRPAPLAFYASPFALQLRNRQRERRLNRRFLRRVLTHTLRSELGVAQAELCFHFVSAAEMARVNWQFLQHEGSTDVITFDHSSTERGTRNAEHGTPGRVERANRCECRTAISD